ncbi:hypothetical protein [Paraburkholderia saeva]|uniref:hypothetical protein n=1 Tax=Paraburkholderia saeva TaxID=2777537 RepID=UPI001D397CBB|nr:hypothetical protein [Paraburkholderia saeva]CAG4926121.1 hypothetical protein R70241_05440 [Paraburkholderia saeva]
MTKKKRSHSGLELMVVDPTTGKAKETGQTAVDVYLHSLVSELERVFVDGYTRVHGVAPSEGLRTFMRVGNFEILDQLFKELAEPLGEYVDHTETRLRQGMRDNTVTPDKERQIRETFMMEAERLRKAGRKITKTALYIEIRERCNIGKTTAKELTKDIPWPPPSLRDSDEASTSESAA